MRASDDDDAAEPASDSEKSPALDRRRLLALSAAGLGGVFAGCGGGGDDGTSTPTPTPMDTPTATTTAPPTDTPTPTTTATQEPTSTAEPTTTQPPTTVPYAPALVSAPGSAVEPTSGFASAQWLQDVDPEIIRVTNLDREGEGSLYNAVQREEPRIVVFEVGGVIDQETWGLEIKENHDDLFIAGQTAPSPGVTVIKGDLTVAAENVIVQHLRIRPGEGVDEQADSMTAQHSSSNVIFDHCSVSWSIDENMSTGGGEDNRNITFSNSLIAEALKDSIHPKGPHSMGSLILNNSQDVAVLGNVYTSNENRNPRLKGGTETAVINNLIYNFDRGVMTGGEGEHPSETSIVGNHYIAGPATDTDDPVVFPRGDTDPPEVYAEDNITEPSSMSFIGDRVNLLDRRQHWPGFPELFEPLPANEVYEHNLRNAGARPADRSPHDQRILDGVRNETSTIVDNEQEAGGYPDFGKTERSLEIPPIGEGFTEWLYQHTRAVSLPDATAPD